MKNKTNILKKIVIIIVSILLILSTAFVIYSLISLTGILLFYRVAGSILLLFFDYIFIDSLIYHSKKIKVKAFYVYTILSILFSLALLVGGYYIFQITSKIDNFSKDNQVYTTLVITYKKDDTSLDKIKDSSLGVVSLETNIQSNILPKELISKYDIDGKEKNNEIKEYDSVEDMLLALINKEIDYIFISSNYKSIYGALEQFEGKLDDLKEVDSYSKKIKDKDISTEENKNTSSTAKKLTEPFTVLLIGVDSEYDGLNANEAFNGDTLMLISFNPDTLQATMFSIPRDTYVPIYCNGNRLKKINTSAYGGTSCVINTIKQFTGINIDYYVKINFKGVVNLVDNLGGIYVDVPMEFCEQNSNREFGDSTICLNTGYQKLDGEQALALARHRKTLVLGDFQRGQNQQLVVEGMINSLKSIKNVNTVVSIFDTISKNIDTNLTKEQILSLYEVGKKMIIGNDNNTINIQKTFLRGYDASVNEYGVDSLRYAFFNYKGSLNEIVTAMKINLGIIEPTLIKTMSFDLNSPYERAIIGDKVYNEPRIVLMPDFSTYTIENAISWLESNNISYVINNPNGGSISPSDYINYKIVSHNPEPYVIVQGINSITLNVESLIETPKTDDEDIEDNTENNEDTNQNNEDNNNNTNNNDNNENNGNEGNTGNNNDNEDTPTTPVDNNGDNENDNND